MAQPEGFSFVRRDDLILISSGNRAVTTLKGDAASRFLARAESLDELGLQHLMARATGNFKRGNERAAGED